MPENAGYFTPIVLYLRTLIAQTGQGHMNFRDTQPRWVLVACGSAVYRPCAMVGLLALFLLAGCGDGYDPASPPKPLAPAAPETFTMRMLSVNGQNLLADNAVSVPAGRPLEIVGEMEFPKGPPGSPVVVSIIKERDGVSITMNQGIGQFEAPNGRTHRFMAKFDAPPQTGDFELTVVALPARVQSPGQPAVPKEYLEAVIFARALLTVVSAE